MKKHFLLVSMIAALALTGCGNNGNSESKEPEQDSSSLPEEKSSSATQVPSTSHYTGLSVNRSSSQTSRPQSSSKASSSSKAASSSAEPAPYAGPTEEGTENANFTLTMPTDVSMMSSNCKQYVDDMRAQQQRLLNEKGRRGAA